MVCSSLWENKIVSSSLDLQNLPLGALRRAQKLLSQVATESDSDDSSEAEQGELHDFKWNTKPQARIASRSNKRAQVNISAVNLVFVKTKSSPIEMSTKRPVSRKRVVVDIPKIASASFLCLVNDAQRNFRLHAIQDF